MKHLYRTYLEHFLSTGREQKGVIGYMLRFHKKDSRQMLKEIAHSRGVSVSAVRKEIQCAIENAQYSDDPEKREEFQRLFGNKTPTPEEFICIVSKKLKFK